MFGSTRQAVLRILFAEPGRRLHLRQIIRDAGAGTGAVQRELARLAAAGIVSSTREGRQTYFQANALCPIFPELRGLIRKTFGLADLLRRALEPLRPEIRVAFVFGSIAAGDETPASDVDLLLVGDHISLNDVLPALAEAQRDVAREINPSIYRAEEFCRKLAEGHHFLSSVAAGPKIYLIGGDGELAELARIRLAEATHEQPAGNRRPARSRRP